jgi:hypothetical protein
MEDEVLDIAGSCPLRLVFPLAGRAEATDAARFGATRRRGLQRRRTVPKKVSPRFLSCPPLGTSRYRGFGAGGRSALGFSCNLAAFFGLAPGLVELHDAFGRFGEAAPPLDPGRRVRHAGRVRPGKFSKLFTRPWKLGLGGGRFLR